MLFKKLWTSQAACLKKWVDKGSEFYNRTMKSWLQGDRNVFNT